MSGLDLLLVVCALPFVGCAMYLAALALLSRVPQPRPAGRRQVRFQVVIPAHNEQQEIAQTVASLLAVDYPRELFRVLVVADNCTDATAAKASAAGARVLVREDLVRRGKGYALADGFEQVLAERFADVIVVVDADTLVSKNLLSAFASRFEQGARVVQADYGVRNPLASWRTRLMTIALAAFHGVRSLGRERLQLSCGLRGNGMGFSAQTLAQYPPKAFSIVEDLDYGIQLGYAGVRAEYVHEARVLGHMAVSENASRSQRQRWERGRSALVREHAWPLLRDAWHRRSLCLLDLALDLIVPPLAQLLIAGVLGLSVALLASSLFDVNVVVATWMWLAVLAGIFVHVGRAWALSGTGAAGIWDLFRVPAYVFWKVTLRFRDKGETPKEWVRTSREVG